MSTHVLPIYNRSDLMFEKGEGCYLFAKNGRKYLDFAAGIAVNALGHNHPRLVAALTEQAKKLWHVSNLYQIEGLDEFADKLAAKSFADRAFFCNSGAEAVECGIKMIRKYHDETGNPDKYRIITFEGSFHGRTMATISASGKENVVKGFGPLLDGFDSVKFGDIEAVKKAIRPETGGILIEPIQGEGGIIPAPEGFLPALRKIADENGLLLFFDEIQCGMGRTGKLFAYENFGIEPDIMALAKGIGGGFPLAACLATENAAKGMQPGTHGSTYGSNPLAMAVGNAVIDAIYEEKILENVNDVGDYLLAGLRKLHNNTKPVIEEIRGMGLMIGLKLSVPNKEFVEKLREKDLLTVAASDNVVRILPPLITTKEHVNEALEIIENVCKEFS